MLDAAAIGSHGTITVINPAFSLVDHDGQPVTLATYHGHWLLVFFGFTHCKIVCPRNLAKLSSVLAKLGDAAAQIRPLYISVDPERDTPERMRAWLGAHYPCFTGLTGDRQAVDDARAKFHVFAQRRDLSEQGDDYDVPHSAITYLIDPEGGYRAHFHEGLDEDTLVARIAGHLGQPGPGS